MPVEKQVISIYSAVKGHLDDIAVSDILRFEKEFLAFLDSNHPQIGQSIRDTKDLVADNEKALVEAINKFKKSFA
jgi:F-type H+-transporting ATPase subunit alpha